MKIQRATDQDQREWLQGRRPCRLGWVVGRVVVAATHSGSSRGQPVGEHGSGLVALAQRGRHGDQDAMLRCCRCTDDHRACKVEQRTAANGTELSIESRLGQVTGVPNTAAPALPSLDLFTYCGSCGARSLSFLTSVPRAHCCALGQSDQFGACGHPGFVPFAGQANAALLLLLPRQTLPTNATTTPPSQSTPPPSQPSCSKSQASQRRPAKQVR